MRRRIPLILASAMVAVVALTPVSPAAASGSLQVNATLRCLVNQQLRTDREAHISMEAAASIQELSDNLSCGQIQSFDGIEELPSLRVLRITNADDTTLGDLTRLSELPLLEELQISPAAGVTDLGPLGDLPNLTRLSLKGMQARDASVLATAPNLRWLTFDYAPNLDIATLAGLDQVRSLRFMNMPFAGVSDSEMDLTGVGDMADLAELDVDYSFLTDLSPLATATQLTRLTLDRNQISDVSPLAALTSLEALNLAQNDVVDVSPLRSLTKLTSLDLGWNDVADVSALAGMTELTTLTLNMNEITDVAPLSGLTNVEELQLWNNNVRDVRPLKGMTRVRTANLGSNRIADVAGLSSWESADTIYLSANAITDLRPLQALDADVRASAQLARVPDGATINTVNPIHNRQARLCPLKFNSRGLAVWECGDGKFDGQVRTTSGDVPGPAPKPSAPQSPAPAPTPTPSPTPSPGTPPFPTLPFSVYNTPGEHTVNDRRWRTSCEPYSQTWRCRTEIRANTVAQENGRFVVRDEWAFNNLTYLPSPHSLWKGNPLGAKGTWTAADGRKWRTDCDSPATGRNGCRSYALTRIIVNTAAQGAPARYAWKSVQIFNNMVQFR